MNGFTPAQKRVSAVLKTVVFVSAVLGTFLSAYAGRGSFMGGLSVFMYFTIQSNLAVALISLMGLVRLSGKRPVSDVWWIVRFAGAVSITLTGTVFCFVLAPTMGAAAWNFQNVLTHIVVPVAMVADFFVTGIRSSIRKRSIFWVLVPPLLYVIYAGIGYVCGWQFAEGICYPYFFLNWGSPAGAFGFTDGLPFMGCVWWILFLLAALLLVGYLYLKILDMIKNVKKKS